MTPAQAWIPSGNRKGSDHRNACGSPDHADPMEMGPHSCRSVLRQRNLPDRGSHDRCEYRSGHEPFLLCRELDTHYPEKIWYDAAVRRRINPTDVEMDIQGYDIDPGAIKAAMENARLAEVDHLIHFQQRPVSKLSHRKKYGLLSQTRLTQTS